MPYITYQMDWKWFKDDAAEPSTQLAAMNTAPKLSPNKNIIRLRFNILTQLGTSSNHAVSLQFSKDNSNFINVGTAADWDYANGQAASGTSIASYKLTSSTGSGQYHEGAFLNENWNNGEQREIDFAIRPNIYNPNQTYYFQVLSDTSAIAPSASKTHPSLTMAGIQIDKTAAWKNASQIQIDVGGEWKDVAQVQIAISGVWRDITT